MTGKPLPYPERNCPLCDGPNGCVPAVSGSFEVSCWCKDVSFSSELLARVPEEARQRACVCRTCATAPTSRD